MANFDASTPQLKLVKNLVDAYASFDMNNVEPLISKNYQYQPFPEITGLSKDAKESHLQTWSGIFAAINKVKVIYHEVIEAPGKVVVHVTGVFSTVLGATLAWDTVLIYTLVEEDGELKVIHCKDFGDPQQRSTFIGGTAKAAVERVAA